MRGKVGVRLIILGVICLAGTSAGAEVKRGDPGATCTTSTETIQGQKASCETCTATKCDTSGSTVSNCRKETTKTCTIGGRVVNPNNKLDFQRAPAGKLLNRSSD